MFAKHPNIAKRWAKETPSFSVLPQHLKKPTPKAAPPGHYPKNNNLRDRKVMAEERGETMPDMELGEIMPKSKKK